MEKLDKKELLKEVEKIIDEGNVFFIASDKTMAYYGPGFKPIKQSLLDSILKDYAEVTQMKEEDTKYVIEMSQKSEAERKEILKEKAKSMLDSLLTDIFGEEKEIK